MKKETIKLKSPAGYVAFLATPIEDLGLSVRTTNCLRRDGIEFAAEFIHKTKEELSKLKGMGRRSLKEIEDFRTEYGLDFKK